MVYTQLFYKTNSKDWKKTNISELLKKQGHHMLEHSMIIWLICWSLTPLSAQLSIMCTCMAAKFYKCSDTFHYILRKFYSNFELTRNNYVSSAQAPVLSTLFSKFSFPHKYYRLPFKKRKKTIQYVLFFFLHCWRPYVCL